MIAQSLYAYRYHCEHKMARKNACFFITKSNGGEFGCRLNAYRFHHNYDYIFTVVCLQWFGQLYHNEIHGTYEFVLNDLVPHMRNPCKTNYRQQHYFMDTHRWR